MFKTLKKTAVLMNLIREFQPPALSLPRGKGQGATAPYQGAGDEQITKCWFRYSQHVDQPVAYCLKANLEKLPFF